MNRNYYVWLRAINERCRLHANPELEIVIVKKGEVAVQHENFEERLTADEATVILPYRLHAFIPSKDAEATVLMFSFSLAEEVYEAYKSKELCKAQIPQIVWEYAQFALENYQKDGDGLTLKSLFFTLIASLLGQQDLKTRKSSVSSVVRKVFEYVFSHLDEPLTLNDMAARLELNRHTVANVFKEYTQSPFREFLKTLRLERAKNLLCTCEKSITDIAYECGFGSLRSFNRAFFERMQCTPSKFKKQTQKN